jgi:hypothetical protein
MHGRCMDTELSNTRSTPGVNPPLVQADADEGCAVQDEAAQVQCGWPPEATKPAGAGWHASETWRSRGQTWRGAHGCCSRKANVVKTVTQEKTPCSTRYKCRCTLGWMRSVYMRYMITTPGTPATIVTAEKV